MNDIIWQLTALRRSMGLSQAAVAELAGLYTPQVSRMENGHHTPTLRVLVAYASALGAELQVVPPTESSPLNQRWAETHRKTRIRITGSTAINDTWEEAVTDALIHGMVHPGDVLRLMTEAFQQGRKRRPSQSSAGARSRAASAAHLAVTRKPEKTDRRSHRVISRNGWSCDVCGKAVNGQTDSTGKPTIEGDVVSHITS